MIIIHRNRNAELYRSIERQNLVWQGTFLRRQISLACPPLELSPEASLKTNCHVSGDLINAFNYLSLANLSLDAGKFRDYDVEIGRSNHQPPPHYHVPDLFRGMVISCHSNWSNWTPEEMSAYLMWRLAWIHPYVDGNGRTSRAAGYFALCTKYQRLLPGRDIVINQLVRNNELYTATLAEADRTYNYGRGQVNLAPLRDLIKECLTHQLSTALEI